MTVIGTLLHELGHYSVSKYLGHEARINYQSSSHWDNAFLEYINEVYDQNSYEIKNNLDFPEKKKFYSAIKKNRSDNFWILLGGPLQTILTGTLGFILLFAYRHQLIKSNNITFVGWSLIFISLFWLRQVANLFMALLTYVNKGKVSPSGDEMELALYLNINIWTIQVGTGLIGLIVLFLILRLLPKTTVLTFLASGLLGGSLGYYLWLIKFGPAIMP